MSQIFANYEAVTLTGTMTFSTGRETGLITATTIHQILCTSNGAITITALGGGTFTWTATAGQTLDILVKSVTVGSGTFVGFKSKHIPPQGRGTSSGWNI